MSPTQRARAVEAMQTRQSLRRDLRRLGSACSRRHGQP